jgi:hypothetical protein
MGSFVRRFNASVKYKSLSTWYSDQTLSASERDMLHVVCAVMTLFPGIFFGHKHAISLNFFLNLWFYAILGKNVAIAIGLLISNF